MRILLIGSGGREHAMGWKLARSPRVSELISLPGNPGLSELGPTVEGIEPADAGAVSAMLVDLSKSGARLRVLGSKSLPSAFALELERDLIVPCEVVHQHDGHVGVKFQRRSG